ncbi:MAG: hypothetical protein AAF557_12785 [Pseudomonadota bacterium]
MTTDQISDEDLVAFLDGEADQTMSARVAKALAEDPALGDRVAALQIETDELRQGFDALLATAPDIAQTAPAPQSAWGGWRAAAAAAVLFVAGLGVGWSIAPGERPTNWHQAVADYQVLYSTATLTNLQMGSDRRTESLARTSRDLGLPLTVDQVSVPGLEFQRAQILDFNGQPLAQLTYLDADGNPIAFCLTRSDIDSKASNQEISGLNAVTWANGGMGFILIGPAPAKTLSDAQAALADQIKI